MRLLFTHNGLSHVENDAASPLPPLCLIIVVPTSAQFLVLNRYADKPARHRQMKSAFSIAHGAVGRGRIRSGTMRRQRNAPSKSE